MLRRREISDLLRRLSGVAYDLAGVEFCGYGPARPLAVLPVMLAFRLRDLFLQGRPPIQHHRKGYGSALRHRHADEKTSAVCCDIAANKTRR